MPEVKKKRIYRLFKVAKEFNIGSDTIVEYLQEKGYEITNSPNTKLSAELYDILMKEYASEKQLKEKAAEFIEKRKEESRVHKEKTEETKEDEHISPLQLKNKLIPRGKAEAVVEEEKPKKEENTAEEVKEVKAEEVEISTPPIEEKTISEENKEEEIDGSPKLKVVGKIDLEEIKKPSKKKIVKSKKKEVKAPEPPKEEKKTEIVVEEEKEKKIDVPPVAKEEPEQKEESAPKEEDEKPEELHKEEEGTVEEEQAPEEIIRAGDSAPRLSGLKVMGKIELESKRKPKKETKKEKEAAKEEPKKQSPSTTENKSSEEEDPSGKKRRKRKRKRKSAVKTDINNDSGNKDGKRRGGRGNKKEKPSTKEVEESIRQTMSQMNQGPSRQRQRLRRAKRDADAAKREQMAQQMEEESKLLEVTEFITANEFADLIEVPVNEIITKSFMLGMMISINQRLDAELISVLAEEYNYTVSFIDVAEQEIEELEEEDDPATLKPRNPIITVMGHVDHGKTTLLDYLRNSNVTSQEAGGITQHIGAYEVNVDEERTVTFLDTPGHEAFTAMRARGAKVTDLVIIVIAADDAVMPQTKEAINHAQAGEVPMIFALNKIDKAGADPDKIKSQLAEMNLLVEDWGGTYQCQEISALKGENVDLLLEKVLLEAELLELQANPDRDAIGTVIESRLDKGRGNVATMLVQNGNLSVGDEMVAGVHYGKVRALINQNGARIKSAGPSQPVQVLGLGGQPQAGDRFHVFEEDGKAKAIAQKRQELFREQQLRQTKRLTLDEIGRRRAIGNFKELNIIIRGDVDGSVEALSGSLLKLSNEEVQVNILLKGVGAINEGDVLLASASDAIIMAFNVRPSSKAKQIAEKEEIDIRTYSVIYDAINDVKDALEGLLSPEIREEIVGTAEVLEVFKISKVGTVAGCLVNSGKIYRSEPIRVIRDGVVIYDSKLSSLKRYQDDVKEVPSGNEFGAMIENYNDVRVGDIIESYRVNEIRRKLS